MKARGDGPMALRRRHAIGAIGVVAALGLPRRALANESRPIRLLALEPGAQTDTVARLFAPAMERALKQEIVIENHGGAGGRIAARAVAQAAPDGLTLGMAGANNLVLASFLKRDIGYDAERSFTHVAALARVPFAIGVRADLGLADLKALVARARAQPEAVNYGTAGVGGSSHLALLAVERQFGVRLTHIPYRGSNLATVEMLAGRIDVVATDLARLLPHAAAGKLRIVALTGRRRSPLAPEVATMAEQGMEDFHLEPWYGLIAPAGLPAAVASRLTAAVQEAAADAELKRQLEARGMEILTPTPAALQALIRDDRRRFAPLVERMDLSGAP
jgi:tripartite-type tricarboxylate transporter receptor subunit TctC